MIRIAIETHQRSCILYSYKKNLSLTKLEKRTKLCNLFQDNNQMYTTAAETKSRKIYDEFGIENQATLFVAFYKLEKVGDYKKNFYKLSPH